MKVPKCGYAGDCGGIEYLVKSTQDSVFMEDLFVCANCLNSRYPGEQFVQVPKPDDILHCLDSVEHNLIKIEHFKEWHKLEKLWRKILPDLDEYKDRHRQLNCDLASAKSTNSWESLPYLHIESRVLLHTLFESQLWKEYCKEQTCREFRDAKHGTRKMYSASKVWVNGQMMKLRDNIANSEYGRLSKKFEQTRKQCNDQENLIKEQQTKIAQQNNSSMLKEIELTRIKEDLQQKNEIINKEKTKFQEKKELIENHKTETEELNKKILIQNELLDQLSQNKINYEKEIERLTYENQQSKKTQLQQLKEIEQLNHEITKGRIIAKKEEDKTQDFKKKQQKGSVSSDVIKFVQETHQKIKKDGKLSFYFSDTKYEQLLEQLSNEIMPPLNDLSFYFLDMLKNTQVLTDFLSNSICESIQKFGLCMFSLSSVTKYKASAIKVLPLVTNEAFLGPFILNQKDFEDILVAAQHTNKIQFHECKIETDKECKFAKRLNSATFQILDFCGTGVQERSSWIEGNHKRFYNIMAGLAKVKSIKNRAITLIVHEDDLDIKETKKTMDDLGLDKISLFTKQEDHSEFGEDQYYQEF
ncbi:unnamed protein product [Moneuplotes crassus]|uniref:Uncharacterized protein n=1 Tax=Euplotes crassus TaxID=5936 RepID=A0AAD2D7V2_EUPCR|nr:unnamed protein product [Moneuplotes crassus]